MGHLWRTVLHLQDILGAEFDADPASFTPRLIDDDPGSLLAGGILNAKIGCRLSKNG